MPPNARNSSNSSINGGRSINRRTDKSYELLRYRTSPKAAQHIRLLRITPDGHALIATTEECHRSLFVGPVAYSRMVQNVIEPMKRQGGGSIINMSSISAHIAQIDLWTYNAAKGAVNQLTRCQALDLGPFNIRVNSVSPGWIWTREVEKASQIDGGGREKWEAIWGKYHLLRRCGEPVECAPTKNVLTYCYEIPRRQIYQVVQLLESASKNEALPAQMMQPIRIIRELKPVKRSEPKPGVFIYDFGDSLAGVCRLRIDGPAGAAVKMRYVEALKPDGTIYVGNLWGLPNVSDTIILDGKGACEFMPLFTYHGFRYVEVSGGASPFTIKEITAVALASDVRRTGEFSCSDQRMNKLVEIIDRAYRSNMFGIMVDSAARDERGAWMGDCFTTQVPSLSYFYDFCAFGANELRLIVDGARSSGIPGSMIGPGGDRAIACWSDSLGTAPYGQWLFFADRHSLELGSSAASRYIDTIAEGGNNGSPGNKYYFRFGDWLGAQMTIPPGADNWYKKGGKGVPQDLFVAAWWAYTVDLVSKTTTASGNPEKSRRFEALAAQARAALVKNHIRPDGTVNGNEQSCYTYALSIGQLDGDLREKVEERLLESIHAYDDHLATGSPTMTFLLNSLAGNGMQDLAYRMVMQPTCPSFGYMVDSGATAMWERLDGWHPKLGFNINIMNGLNHLGWNSISEWIFGHIAGIQPDWQSPGFKHFFIAPKLGGGLTYMNSAYDSIRGRIVSNYEIKKSTLTMTVIVPPNTTATVTLPVTTLEGVTESGKPLSKSQGVIIPDYTANTVDIQSGTYIFTMLHE